MPWNVIDRMKKKTGEFTLEAACYLIQHGAVFYDAMTDLTARPWLANLLDVLVWDVAPLAAVNYASDQLQDRLYEQENPAATALAYAISSATWSYTLFRVIKFKMRVAGATVFEGQALTAIDNNNNIKCKELGLAAGDTWMRPVTGAVRSFIAYTVIDMALAQMSVIPVVHIVATLGRIQHTGGYVYESITPMSYRHQVQNMQQHSALIFSFGLSHFMLRELISFAIQMLALGFIPAEYYKEMIGQLCICLEMLIAAKMVLPEPVIYADRGEYNPLVLCQKAIGLPVDVFLSGLKVKTPECYTYYINQSGCALISVDSDPTQVLFKDLLTNELQGRSGIVLFADRLFYADRKKWRLTELKVAGNGADVLCGDKIRYLVQLKAKIKKTSRYTLANQQEMEWIVHLTGRAPDFWEWLQPSLIEAWQHPLWSHPFWRSSLFQFLVPSFLRDLKAVETDPVFARQLTLWRQKMIEVIEVIQTLKRDRRVKLGLVVAREFPNLSIDIGARFFGFPPILIQLLLKIASNDGSFQLIEKIRLALDTKSVRKLPNLDEELRTLMSIFDDDTSQPTALHGRGDVLAEESEEVDAHEAAKLFREEGYDADDSEDVGALINTLLARSPNHHQVGQDFSLGRSSPAFFAGSSDTIRRRPRILTDEEASNDVEVRLNEANNGNK